MESAALQPRLVVRPRVAGAGDGKSRRRSHGTGQAVPPLLSAMLPQEAGVVAQREGEEKTPAIPKWPQLLAPLPRAGRVVAADALHTQKQTARYRVEEKKADSRCIAKDNQPTLRQDLADLKLDTFPPSVHHAR